MVATWSGSVVEVWDPVTGRVFFPPLKHAFPVTWVEFNPDDTRIVTCGADPGFTKCHAQVWSSTTGRPVVLLQTWAWHLVKPGSAPQVTIRVSSGLNSTHVTGNACFNGGKNTRPVTGSHTSTTLPLQVATIFSAELKTPERIFSPCKILLESGVPEDRKS